jgi:hypothetical protein
MAQPIFTNLGMYIIAPELIPMAYFINPSYRSLSIWVSFIFARQRISEKVIAAMNTHATVEEMFDA